MMRITLQKILVAATCALAVGLSCDACIQAVRSVQMDWTIVEPGLLQDLPQILCASCPVASSCVALVTSGIRAVALEINKTDALGACAHLGLCNESTMLVV